MNEETPIDILLVEDDPHDLELALRALRKVTLTHRVLVAHDGAEALEFIFCHGAHAARRIEDGPKLILLDLNLPAVNGLEVLRRIKNDPRTRSLPVVVLTSSRQEIDEVKSYEAGVNSYIVKPMTFESFTLAVQQLGTDCLLNHHP